ncbi:MAG: hypothetical protein GWP61_23270 [Chloroflexi bacterium]|jgi:hypothetical protein|nr:hypothetical protein [Chloroflexota bacterium]
MHSNRQTPFTLVARLVMGQSPDGTALAQALFGQNAASTTVEPESGAGGFPAPLYRRSMALKSTSYDSSLAIP